MNTYGVDWDEKNVPVLYVDGVGGLYAELERTTSKKLIIMENEYTPRQGIDDSEEDFHGKLFAHEWGHNCMLNHTDENNNIMESPPKGWNVSTDIAEISSGSEYTGCQENHRDQVDQFKTFNGWVDPNCD